MDELEDADHKAILEKWKCKDGSQLLSSTTWV